MTYLPINGWSENVKVEPWVGENYFVSPSSGSFHYRTLILGESNFTKPGNFHRKLVQECVRDDMSTNWEVRDTQGFCKFSTKIRRVIGIDEQLGPEGLWKNVAFYNFVQFLVGEKAKVRPEEWMWVDSVPAFHEIITTLEPERIIVLGEMNWQNLLKYIDNDPIDEFLAILKVDGRKIKSGFINHPSSFGFSYVKWQPIVKNILT
jgi:hypothetical protein